MAAKQSEFEEKEFEAPLYNQLSCGNINKEMWFGHFVASRDSSIMFVAPLIKGAKPDHTG